MRRLEESAFAAACAVLALAVSIGIIVMVIQGVIPWWILLLN